MHDERLDVENLHLWRGDRHVLRGVSFSLSRGECLQVTGPNGSGKTSLLRTLSALMYAEEGRVLWRGQDVRADLAAFHGALAYLGHEPPLKGELSARENLRYWIGVRRRIGSRALEAALEPVGAGAWCDRRVRPRSAGPRPRLRRRRGRTPPRPRCSRPRASRSRAICDSPSASATSWCSRSRSMRWSRCCSRCRFRRSCRACAR